MAYVKHPVHGNKHVEDSEVAALVEAGWTQWPRKAEDKALGDGSDAAYWRKKYERDMAASLGLDTLALLKNAKVNDGGCADSIAPNLGGGGGPIEPASAPVEDAPRRGRPPKA